MSSRNTILKKLRAAQQPFTGIPPVAERRNMVPLVDTAPEALFQRFVKEAEKLGCRVYTVPDGEAAIEQVLTLAQGEKAVSAWDEPFIPAAGLKTALENAGMCVSRAGDATVSFGITGVDAALAATGSLVLVSGPGKFRTVSLLPEKHIMILQAEQIIPDLEAWFVHQRARGLDAFRKAANVVVVSGLSKTADIAQELILGAHGPKEIHLIVIR